MRAAPYRIGKTTVKEKFLRGSGSIVTCAVRYFSTPFTLIACVAYVVSPRPHSSCACATCKSSIEPGLIGFVKRFWAVLVVQCFAPYHLPEKLWRKIFPPPCSHNRCKLRRYVSPPPPWYHPLKRLYQPIQRQYIRLSGLRQSPTPFPFLRLPLELRNQIYLHASHANTRHSIQVSSPWRAGKRTQHFCGYTSATTLVAEYDAAKYDANTRRSVRSEDAISYQLNDNGIIAVHGAPPPTNLLLVSRQVYEEAREAFWRTTAFEVQPLSPNDACWRLDQSLTPTYEALASSKYAKEMRKVRVRIDVARFSKGRECKRFERVNAQVCAFWEIGLEVCAQTLVPLAEELCAVLEMNAPNLGVVEIEWVDDFPEAVEGADQQARANVLVPFTSLPGVKVRIGKLVMAGKGRGEVMTMMKQVLGGVYGDT